MRGYWFSKADGTTENLTDPARIGKTYQHTGKCVPCVSGLHWSPTPWDALGYASGPVLWEVEGDEDAVPDGDPVDKYCGRWRTHLRRVDLTPVCYRFAAEQALSVMGLWDAPEIVREYLTDTAAGRDRSDIRLAAQDAAGDAAKAATRVAWDTPWDARAVPWTVRSAARATLWAAARDAWDGAWDAAMYGARAAGWAILRDAGAAVRAARDVARAAEDAAWDSAKARFNALALEALEEGVDSIDGARGQR